MQIAIGTKQKHPLAVDQWCRSRRTAVVEFSLGGVLDAPQLKPRERVETTKDVFAVVEAAVAENHERFGCRDASQSGLGELRFPDNLRSIGQP